MVPAPPVMDTLRLLVPPSQMVSSDGSAVITISGITVTVAIALVTSSQPLAEALTTT